MMNAARSMCGYTWPRPARLPIERTHRCAVRRSSRCPSRRRRIGPSWRSPTARSMVRAVRGTSGIVAGGRTRPGWSGSGRRCERTGRSRTLSRAASRSSMLPALVPPWSLARARCAGGLRRARDVMVGGPLEEAAQVVPVRLQGAAAVARQERRRRELRLVEPGIVERRLHRRTGGSDRGPRWSPHRVGRSSRRLTGPGGQRDLPVHQPAVGGTLAGHFGR